MIGAYSLQIIPPASPASVGQYALRIGEDGRFELVCRVLTNTPADRDWRAEWNAVEGTVVAEGSQLRFTVERGQRQIRSSAWSGRGVEDYHPLDHFTGTHSQAGITIDYFGRIALRTVQEVSLERALIVPDYLFG